MVTILDRTTIDPYVAQPGVGLLNWSAPRNPLARLFDAVYASVSAHHPDVRFAAVDALRDPGLTSAWGITEVPELMAYRDGTLLFAHGGLLAEPVMEALIEAVQSLDMEVVRQGIDGHGARLRLAWQPTGTPRFALEDEETGPDRSPPGRAQ